MRADGKRAAGGGGRRAFASELDVNFLPQLSGACVHSYEVRLWLGVMDYDLGNLWRWRCREGWTTGQNLMWPGMQEGESPFG